MYGNDKPLPKTCTHRNNDRGVFRLFNRIGIDRYIEICAGWILYDGNREKFLDETPLENHVVT